MSKRHMLRPGDWEAVAVRLDEIISAHSGEDPFEEALKLLVAKLASESFAGQSPSEFLASVGGSDPVAAIDRLLGMAGKKWGGILEPAAACKLNPAELRRCADVLSSVDLLTADLVGLDAIFEFIVSKAAKGQKGQYFTPRHVIAEVVRMTGIKSGDNVVDPACGSGGFLRHALLEEPKCAAWGFDQDARATRVARVMLAASGQPASRVMRADSLRRPDADLFSEPAPVIEELMRAHSPRFRGFDVVLTNPPFAGDVGKEYSGSYALAKGKRVERDVLFIERCVSLLRPGGRLAIVLPHNKVAGDQWTYAREWLLQQMQVVAVVGLGRNTFMPHTSQKACVLFGVKRKKPTSNHRSELVQFFISDNDGKDNRGRLRFQADGMTIDHDLAEATAIVGAAFQSACALGE